MVSECLAIGIFLNFRRTLKTRKLRYMYHKIALQTFVTEIHVYVRHIIYLKTIIIIRKLGHPNIFTLVPHIPVNRSYTINYKEGRHTHTLPLSNEFKEEIHLLKVFKDSFGCLNLTFKKITTF